MSPLLRPARPEDADEVTRLEADLFGVDAWSPEMVAHELSADRRRVLVALGESGVLEGYAVTSVAGDVVDLQRIAVRPEARRRGLAARLLAEVSGLARADGAHRMLLEVSAANAGAIAFYAAAGFIEIDRRPRYYRDGTDALVLRADLGTVGCGRKGA